MTRAARVQPGRSLVCRCGGRLQVDHFLKWSGVPCEYLVARPWLDYGPGSDINSSEMVFESFRLCCNNFRKLFEMATAGWSSGDC